MKTKILLILMAFATIVACDNNDGKPQRSEYDIAIDNLMAQCKNFDAEMLIQGLPGVWEINSLVTYNADWSTIDQPHLPKAAIPSRWSLTWTVLRVLYTASMPIPPPSSSTKREICRPITWAQWTQVCSNRELI